MPTVDRAEVAELLKEVRRIKVQSSRLVAGVMAGGYTSVFRGAGIEFHEVREYVDGDDPRSVDWNVTARVGRPFVKKYIDERELTVLFLLDTSASMKAGFGIWSPRQMAARVCACLALSAVKNNDKVGLIAFSDGVDKYVPPKKGVSHALRIVRDCLALPGKGVATRLAPAREFASRGVAKRTILFIVSDFLTDGWERDLQLCARRHDVIAVRLVNPELTTPPTGLLRVRDPELGGTSLVDWSHAATRAAYVQRIAEWRQQTAAMLRRVNVDLMDVAVPRRPTKDGVARPILGFFRMREQRAAKR